MKISEIREMTPDERQQKLEELQNGLFNLKFQHKSGQLENPQKMKQAKRDVARIHTLIREAESAKKTTG